MKISEFINALEKIRGEHAGDVKVLVEENYLDSFRYAGSNKKALEDHGYTDATRKDLSSNREGSYSSRGPSSARWRDSRQTRARYAPDSFDSRLGGLVSSRAYSSIEQTKKG